MDIYVLRLTAQLVDSDAEACPSELLEQPVVNELLSLCGQELQG